MLFEAGLKQNFDDTKQRSRAANLIRHRNQCAARWAIRCGNKGYTLRAQITGSAWVGGQIHNRIEVAVIDVIEIARGASTLLTLITSMRLVAPLVTNMRWLSGSCATISEPAVTLLAKLPRRISSTEFAYGAPGRANILRD